jgi:hypothetical protein
VNLVETLPEVADPLDPSGHSVFQVLEALGQSGPVTGQKSVQEDQKVSGPVHRLTNAFQEAAQLLEASLGDLVNPVADSAADAFQF